MSELAFERAKVEQGSAKPVKVLQRACACGQHTHACGECEGCKQKRAGLQRAPLSLQGSMSIRRIVNVAGDRGEGDFTPPIVSEVLRSPGKLLDTDTRRFMEPRFGHDFSRVRIHTDKKAAQSAQAVNALAYTVGNDIAFGAGQYSPRTRAGKKLLAHELAHVVQQQDLESGNAGLPQQFSIQENSSPLEREADRAAEQVASGDQVRLIPAVDHGRLQRQGIPGIYDRGQLCGDFSDFLRGVSMQDLARTGYIFPDMVTCLCLGFTGVDLLPIPGIGNNLVVEAFDCGCNVLTLLQELYERGNKGGCFSWANLSASDQAALSILGGAVAADCVSWLLGISLGPWIGALIFGGGGSTAGPEVGVPSGVGGAAAGAVIGDFLFDVAAELVKNQMIQGYPLPVDQAHACERFVNWLGELELPEAPPLVGF